ncbi:phosphatase 2C-like [Raphidocelis subcapitata]|uniref:Phosphatase 2C-like n=1 Tax=Raphidocelis subcapitata TaxID=307507 RepID=A0A2V0P267_9CHLO|nr:phosphatase 2C-like [Raphidocelis subcapitata]|eukprot:GBF93966.1 phosphatase 2C-like [Raphidocelis subcapitata]
MLASALAAARPLGGAAVLLDPPPGVAAAPESLAAALAYAPPRIRSGAAADQGRRSQMEDASIACDDVAAAAASCGCVPRPCSKAAAADGAAAAAATAAGAGAAAAAGGAACAACRAGAPAWLHDAAELPACAGFYAVFDGHCGASAAQFAAARALGRVVHSLHFPREPAAALTDAFLSIEAEYEAVVSRGAAAAAGTTALAALVWGGRVVLANAGDSRAVLSRRGKAIELTTDHKPADPVERSRIESAGGYVCEDGLLCGELAVSRALGDYHLAALKRAGSRAGTGPLTAEPEITDYRLAGPDDEFIILGCDGVWDVFPSQRAVEFARQRLRLHNDPARCAEELVAEALRMHSSDNLTVVVICLGEDPPQPRVYSGSAFSGGASRRTSLDGSRRCSASDSMATPGPSPGCRPAASPCRTPSPLTLDGSLSEAAARGDEAAGRRAGASAGAAGVGAPQALPTPAAPRPPQRQRQHEAAR